MVLECLDSLLCNVPSMVVWRYQLVLHFIELNDCSEFVGYLVVENVLLGVYLASM